MFPASTSPTSRPARRPTITNVLGTLEGITDYGDNYGERIRGYFTAPATGNYYFWIAGSDSAQLWISDDGEPVNKVLRAWVTPTNNPTAPATTALRRANGMCSRASNPAGSRSSPGRNITSKSCTRPASARATTGRSAGCRIRPARTPRPPASCRAICCRAIIRRCRSNVPGTLYSANMLALPGVDSDGVGSATLRVSADGSQAILNFPVNNLVGTPTGESINSDPYLNNPGELIFDISAANPQADGSYLWNIKADRTALAPRTSWKSSTKAKPPSSSKARHFPTAKSAGISRWPTARRLSPRRPRRRPGRMTHANPNAAARFLTQATFGASSERHRLRAIARLRGWINNQFSLPATHHLPIVLANPEFRPDRSCIPAS